MRGLASLILWLLLAGCGTKSSAPEMAPDFFARTTQPVHERLIKASLHAIDSLNLSAFEIYEPQRLCKTGKYLMLFDRDLGKIAVFDRDLQGRPFFIGKGRGEGPGELLGITDMDAYDDRVFLFSGVRVVGWSTSGELILDKKMEIEAYRGEAINKDRLLILSPASPDYLFNIVDMEGRVVRGFVRTNLEQVSPLRYSGDLAFDGRYLYFAGEPEPLLKKYTLEGRQLFSMATIDNLPSEGNYVQFEGGAESMAMGYSPYALFSTAMIEVYDGYLLAVPIHDENRSLLSYIDVYATRDGHYLATYDLAQMPQALAVDADGIYTLEYHGGDAYLKRYPNLLAELAEHLPNTP